MKLVDDISEHLIIVLKPRAATGPAERQEPRAESPTPGSPAREAMANLRLAELPGHGPA